MRAIDKTPSELIEHVANIISDRANKKLPTFYTISIEQYGKVTPVAEKEAGHDNFKNDVFKYLTDYDLTAIVVELYSGKSRNVKKPFQFFKIELKKQNPTIILGNADSEPVQEAKQLDSSIPVSRYYDEKFELQMRIMRTEMEKQGMADRLVHIAEKYEDRLKDQEKTYLEKLRLLEQDLKEAREDVAEFEREIARYEREKHNSFGNIALGSIGSRLVENLAKSDFGTGVLKGLLGKEGFDTLQGHLAGIENEQNSLPERPTARIITQAETATGKDPRTVALNYIQSVGQALPDMYLRMLYDLAEISAKNAQSLHIIWSYAQQLEQQNAKPVVTPNPGKETTTPNEETEEEEEETGEENPPTNIN